MAEQIFQVGKSALNSSSLSKRGSSGLPVEGLVWGDGSKMSGYLSGGQWFNPLTIAPHPMLQHKLPQTQQRAYDWCLTVTGMSLYDAGTLVAILNKTKTGSLQSYRSTGRLAYCLFVDLMLLVNSLRLLATFFVHDKASRFFLLGDLSLFWTERTHYVIVPLLFLNVSALAINLTFQLLQTDKSSKWILPFAIFSGE